MPPADAWPPAGQGPDRGSGRGRRVWPVVLGLVTALALTAVVATAVVVTLRARQTEVATPSPVTSSASPTVRYRPAPVPSTPGVSTAPAAPPDSSTPQPSTDPTEPAPGSTSSAVAATSSPTAGTPDVLPTTSSTPTTNLGPDRSLRTNTLYRVDLADATSACGLEVRRPKPPLADKALQPYLAEVLDCLTATFDRPLATQGFTLAEPTVQTYHRRIDTPCGDFGQDGSPAYYCSTTRTIYWPDTVDDGREAYTFARLGYVGLTAHEFGHHLQATTGMLNAYAGAYEDASTEQRYVLSRRLELQAQCFEGVFLHVTRRELGVGPKDRAELKAWHGYTGDEDPPEDRKPDHGSSRAQFGWLERGLDSGDFADCNTWTASSKSVT